MNASRASLALALAALLLPPPAAAQTSTPVELAPPSATEAPGRPRLLAPPGEEETQAPPATWPPAAVGMGGMEGMGPRVPKGFEVDQLSAVSPDSGGALGPAQGGFGPTLWEGTKRPLVDALLPSLPMRAGSPAMRDLARRLLLSSARAPEGPGEPGGLLAQRIRLLAAMGDLEGVKGLIAILPRDAKPEPLLRLENEALLLAGEIPGACTHATGQIRQGTIAYWQKVMIFCQMLAGERHKASLGADLLRESEQEDPGFFLLLEAFGAKKPPAFPGIPNPTALHIAMARAAHVDLPPEILKTAPPAVVRTLAMDRNLPLDLRLLAAEQAQATGALAPEHLRDLYAALPFSDEEKANPISAAQALAALAAQAAKPKTPPPPPAKGAVQPKKETGLDPAIKARALLFSAALGEKGPAARAELVAAAFSLARKEARFAEAARVLLPAVEALEPSGELTDLAPEAARALLLSGRNERAGAWYRQIKGKASASPAAAKEAARLKPLLRLAGMTEAADWSPKDLDAWWEAVKGAKDARDRAALLFGLMEGFENFVPDPFWDRLMAGAATGEATMPHAALWHRLGVATRFGRVGETVLVSLIVLGDDGPAQAHPILLRQAVAALRAVRLDADARALALEAAVAGDGR